MPASDEPDDRHPSGDTGPESESPVRADGGVTTTVPERDPGRFGRLSATFGRRIVTGVIAVTVVFLVGPVLITFGASFAQRGVGVVPTGFVTLDNWLHVLGLESGGVGAQRALGEFTLQAFGWEVTVPFFRWCSASASRWAGWSSTCSSASRSRTPSPGTTSTAITG
jgi:hypothetical protein